MRASRHAGADTARMRWLATLACAAALAGCGSDRSESLPAPCTEGPGSVLRALSAAPGDVRMGGVLISECFNRDATGEDELIVGTNLIAAAQELGDIAREEPESEESLRLGYLVGAARRGAARNGLAAELLRRIEQVPTLPVIESGAYQRGLRAGVRTG